MLYFNRILTAIMLYLAPSFTQGFYILFLWSLTNGLLQIEPHCPKTNLNLCVRTEPVMVGADATVYIYNLVLVQI